MTDHLTEEEQIEALKKWWKENGKSIIFGIIIGIGVIVGFWKWNERTETQALAASLEYDNFSSLLSTDKADAVAKSYAVLTSDYADTSYATLAAMRYATYEYNKKNTEKALEYLRWANQHAGNEALSHVIRIRLARLLVAEKKADEAFNLVDKIKEPAFDTEYAEIKGDIFRLRGDATQARSAYQTALLSTRLAGKQREFIQMKMDNLNVSSSPAESTPIQDNNATAPSTEATTTSDNAAATTAPDVQETK